MKTSFIILFLFLYSKSSFCQLSQQLKNGKVKDRFEYHYDTLKVVDDSFYVNAKEYYNKNLIHQEEQILVRQKATTSHPTEKPIYGYRIMYHGHSIQLYSNGQKKCEGTFNYGKKQNDWKYWSEKGKEINYCPEKVF